MPIDAASIVNKIMQGRSDKNADQEKVIENVEEWRKAVNRIATSPDGKLLIKLILRYNKLFMVDNARDHATMLRDSGAQNMYLYLVRQFLEPQVASDVETQDLHK